MQHLTIYIKGDARLQNIMRGGGFLLTVFEISTSGFLQSSSFVVNFIILKAS